MPHIQLQPHLFTSLPSHPSLPNDSPRPDPNQFARTALHEALELLDSFPSLLTTDSKLRSSSPSEAKVKLLRGWRKPSEQNADASNAKDKPEFWVCRQSEHADSSTKGTASWSEFEAGLRSDHAEHEMEYTPSVTSVERLLEWSGQEFGEVEVNGIQFGDVVVEVNLITHTFHPSALIAPRSFISQTISAAYDNRPAQAEDQSPETQQSQSPTKGFLTVQVPLRSTPQSTPSALHQKITSAVPRRTIFANYASVERVTLLPTPSPTQPATSSAPAPAETQPTHSSNDSRRIEWTMATTSDAGGSIPQWVQRSWTLGGVPRAVVADVGLFIGWTMRRRG